MAEKINGALLAESILVNIKNTIAAEGFKPGLAIIRIGDDTASELFVRLKKKAAQKVGIKFHEYLLASDICDEEVLKTIDWLNKHPRTHAIVVQLPLPAHLDEDIIIKAINPLKDADGFHPENIKKLLAGESAYEPAVIRTIFSLLSLIGKSLENKKALIIANAEIFSKPLCYLLKHQNISAEYLSPDNNALSKKLKASDIVVVAVGKKNFIKDTDCKKGAIVIDVGINKDASGVCGDVDGAVYTTKGNIAYVTPVPGGVGPVTIAMLLTNVLDLYLRTNSTLSTTHLAKTE
ncbi:MAG: bifunctional methylenetetrahydrofolate dehydrogenase/methenyltetrahydrofolate cyclohydrolase [Chloroflexi bacterium]|nr:bifunctional methylenetetrahydrofolate dehydrogenase/methenyltetrahydrofolate cyclohydrolase [Chloroflexota bacterium]